jgi:lambda repressor-like predicted transcriptional regulator
MDHIDIQHALRKAGYRLAQVAANLGVSRSAVNQCLDRSHRSARIEQHVAKLTALPLETLFPDRYPEK